MATTESSTFGIAHPTVVPTNFVSDVPDATAAGTDHDGDRNARSSEQSREQ